MQVLKLGGPTYATNDLGWDAQRIINLVPEIDESSDAKAGINVRAVTAPGVKLVNATPNMSIRALATLSTGQTIAVIQNTVEQRTMPYIVNADYSLTPIPLTSSYPTYTPDNPVYNYGWSVSNVYFERWPIRMAHNGSDLVIVDHWYTVKVNIGSLKPANATPCWTFLRNSTNGAIEPFKAVDVAFIGGYHVYAKDPTYDAVSSNYGQFYVSQLYNPDYDPLDIASAEYKADQLIAMGGMSSSLWLFGSRSLEVWANTGGVGFPFERIQGATSDVGCLSLTSLQQLSDAFIWLACTSGGRPFIAMTNGYTPAKISTLPIDSALASIDAAWLTYTTSFTYSMNGHYFYGLNIPALGTTFVYDLHTKLWHERRGYDRFTGALTAIGYAHSSPGITTEKLVYRPGEPGLFVLDYAETKLATITEPAGQDMYCERSFPIVADANGSLIRQHKLQLDSASGTASQPAYTLQWSDNSGRDFVDGRTLQPADVGEYNERFIWRRLGTSRARLYKLSFTTAKHLSLRSVTLDAETLNA